jgi:hypothetical protein
MQPNPWTEIKGPAAAAAAPEDLGHPPQHVLYFKHTCFGFSIPPDSFKDVPVLLLALQGFGSDSAEYR